MSFNKFEDRVKKVIKLRNKVEQETSQIKIHAFNITAPPDVMLERAKFVKNAGGRCVMVDIVSVGLDNVQWLRKQNLGLIIHGHRAGHSMFTRDEHHGMTMLVLAKLSRLAGIDQLHTGTIVGKMDGDKKEVTEINMQLKEDWKTHNVLRDDWSKLKPVLPIASGGLHPGLVKKMIKILGNDVIINFGGGLHGHPSGSVAGAKACYDAVTGGKGVELEEALKYWG